MSDQTERWAFERIQELETQTKRQRQRIYELKISRAYWKARSNRADALQAKVKKLERRIEVLNARPAAR